MTYSNKFNKEANQAKLTKIRDAIAWGAQQFTQAGLAFGHGTDNAEDEAAWLVAYATKLTFAELLENLDKSLTEAECAQIVNLFNRRITERIPAAYLTHQAWFAGLEFYVDERVLVPRSPIAELIEQHFQPWINPKQVNKILDLATGSGCIAIACALAFPHAKVDATDISPQALAVAERNCQLHKVSEQVTLLQADVFAGLPATRYDIIVSNPPYVDREDLAQMPPEFHHEPQLGLAAGKDGLDIVKRILLSAKQYLTTHGILILEVGNSAAAFTQQFPELNCIWLEFARGGAGVLLLHSQDL